MTSTISYFHYCKLLWLLLRPYPQLVTSVNHHLPPLSSLLAIFVEHRIPNHFYNLHLWSLLTEPVEPWRHHTIGDCILVVIVKLCWPLKLMIMTINNDNWSNLLRHQSLQPTMSLLTFIFTVIWISMKNILYYWRFFYIPSMIISHQWECSYYTNVLIQQLQESDAWEWDS